MNRPFRRIEHVSESVVEPLQPLITEELPVGESFEVLYRRTFPRVYGYVASLLRDRSAAEEVTAQAFERAYRRRRTFRPRRGSVDAWIFGIARNAALDELRRLKRHAALAVEPAAEQESDTTLQRATVRQAVAQLDPRDRDLVALKFAGGLSNAEIARVLG